MTNKKLANTLFRMLGGPCPEDIEQALNETEERGRKAGLEEAAKIAADFCMNCSLGVGPANATVHNITRAILNRCEEGRDE